jgi:small subunit ribosomal protein S15
MALNAEDKREILAKYQKGDSDTGSASVQVALLTARIKYLTEHFKTHKKDHASRRGLLRLVGQRRKLLKYIRNGDQQKYQDLIKSLGLRR